MGPGKSTLLALLMITGLVQRATAASYAVGDSTGWTVPSSATFYDDWARGKTFFVGDQLVFTYSAQNHNVYEVTAADLASCNLANPLATHETSGGATITLTTPGSHNFICGFPTHCSLNMKLSVQITGPAPTVAPVLPPTPAPVSPPTAAPVSPPTPAPISPPTPAPVSPPTPAPISPPTPSPVSPPAKTPSPVPSSKSPSPAPATKLSPSPTPMKTAPAPAPGTLVEGPAFAPGPSTTTTGGAPVLRSASTVIVGAVIAAVTAGALML